MDYKLSKEEQIKRLQLILKSDKMDECGNCGKKFVGFYMYEGYTLCPDCDHEFLESKKKRD